MPFSNLRNLSGVATDRGSELAAYAEVTNTETYALGSQYSMPYFSNSNLDVQANSTDVQLEGEGVVKIFGTKTRTFPMTFVQRDAEAIDFYTNVLEDKKICIVKQVISKAVNEKFQWLVIPIAEADPSFNIPSTGFEIEKTFNIINNTESITIDLTDFNTPGGWTPAITCTSFAIAANKGFAYYTQDEV